MFYHLTSNHSMTTLLFRDNEDRLFFLNRMAMLAIALGVGIYAYCLMDNHIHLLVKGDEGSILQFFSTLKKDYAQYASSKYGDNSFLKDFQPDIKQITNRDYLKSAVAYILRNPFKAGMSCPYSYRWSSAWIYFRRQFWTMAEKTAKEYGTANLRAMLHTRKKMEDDMLFCGDVISPRHWVLYAKVEELFGTSSDLFKAVSRYNTENEMESFLLQKEIYSYSDDYLLNVIRAYCADFGAATVSDLGTVSFRKLVSRLARQYGSSRKQIARLTGADEETLLRFA